MRAGSALTPLASAALRDSGGSLIIFREATERCGEGQVKKKRMKMRWGSRVERRPREADMTSHASSSLRGAFLARCPILYCRRLPFYFSKCVSDKSAQEITSTELISSPVSNPTIPPTQILPEVLGESHRNGPGCISV